MSPATKPAEAGTVTPPSPPTWGFLTNYALALLYIVLHPDSTVRAIALGIGITERATLAILHDFDLDALVSRKRDGRRNTYSVNFQRLAQVRRGGGANAGLTPRIFVDVVVRMLFSLADPSGEHSRPSETAAQESELEPRAGSWGFFTNHLLVLLAIAHDRSRTVRELAAAIGITERAVLGILGQLEAEGIITRSREGRRTSYTMDFEKFRAFRGWSFESWSLPAALIDVATNGLSAVAAASPDG